tara:strand:- start:1501 stop:2064 length:564 start_codon:yes stop_codon:yes gene_type:complete
MRIALVTIPRSGSTFYCRKLAQDYNLKNLKELFKNEKVNIDNALRSWSKGNCVAKIFTRDFINIPNADMPLEHYENLVYGTADKIFYLYRKNTIDHIKSNLTANYLNNHSPYKEHKIIHVKVSPEDIVSTFEKINLDVQRLDNVAERYPGEKVYLEDFATKDRKYKYTSIFYNESNIQYPEDLNLSL